MTRPLTREEVRTMQLGNRAQQQRLYDEEARAKAISARARKPAIAPSRAALQKPSRAVVKSYI